MVTLGVMALAACTDQAAATLVPVPSHEDRAASAGWLAGGDWLGQHEDINAIGRSRPDLELVFLGDSITQSWGGPGRQVGSTAGELWSQRFGGYDAANFGISGDRTQHLLWRIAHGNFDGLAPRAVVLMIGTNNLAHDEAQDIAAGIVAVVDALQVELPNTEILLHGMLPRGRSVDEPIRIKSADVQRRIGHLGQRDGVTLVDLWPHVMDGEGVSNPHVFRSDWLHLQPGGYVVWADALQPHLERLFGES
jgi:lysophospholipase L1-like esterase